MYGALSQDLLAQNAVKCSDTIRELAPKVQPTVRQEIGEHEIIDREALAEKDIGS